MLPPVPGSVIDLHPACPHTSQMKRSRASAIGLAVSVIAVGVLAAPAEATTCGRTAYADGTFGPALCRNGDANQAVAKAYAAAAPAIMALGAESSRRQIQAAVCSDRDRGATGESLYDALEWQAADHDWKRSVVHEVNRRLIAGRYC